jgi:hypothetical protein
MYFANVAGPHAREVFAATVCAAWVPVFPAGVRPGSTIVTFVGVPPTVTTSIAPALTSLPLMVSEADTATPVQRVPAAGKTQVYWATTVPPRHAKEPPGLGGQDVQGAQRSRLPVGRRLKIISGWPETFPDDD